MNIYFIKFIHLVLIISLIGVTFYCLTKSGFKRNQHNQLNRIILYILLFAMVTGTLLVYPKHYTFHTPWIIAAYVLCVVFSLGILFLYRVKHRSTQITSYGVLLTLLIFVVHDAVTKTTFLF